MDNGFSQRLPELLPIVEIHHGSEKEEYLPAKNQSLPRHSPQTPTPQKAGLQAAAALTAAAPGLYN